MRGAIRVSSGAALTGVLMLAACGSQSGQPQFVQAFGVIDSPCAVQGSPSTAVQHCVGHVLLQNQGGEGYGHLTVLIQLQIAKASAANVAPARCGASIPDTPAGGYSDVVCKFDLAPGQSIVTYPVVQSIDFVGASAGGASDSSSGQIPTLILTAATALLAIAALIVVRSAGRQPPAPEEEATESSPPTPGATPTPPRDSEPSGRRPTKPGGIDAEYDLPQLPR